MRLSAALSLLALILSSTLASAKDPVREIRRSPDGRYFVGWFDYDAGAPFGFVRPIVVRSASDLYDIFSFVSSPRYTDAAWNTASTKCVIADAPDNGGPKIWLIHQKSHEEWASSEIEPFSTLYEAFRKTDPDVRHLFRPSILKMTWLSDAHLRFRVYCNTGTYLITIDTADRKQPPTLEKVSNEWLEE